MRVVLGYNLRVIVLTLKGDMLRLFKEAEITTKLASADPEAKPESLVGVYYIFMGFLLQLAGAVFWGVDAIWGIAHPRIAGVDRSRAASSADYKPNAMLSSTRRCCAAS